MALPQGGAALAPGYHFVVPTGLQLCSLCSHVQLNENAQRCAAEGVGLKPRHDRRIRCNKSWRAPVLSSSGPMTSIAD